MKTQNLEIKAQIQISKTPHEVFEAIVDPSKMTNYFISQSTGRMEEGENLIWHFPEINEAVPVRIGKIESDNYISFYWDDMDGTQLLVEITLIPKEKSTLVRITEKSRENDENGIKWLKSNTEGWANFLASLKAFLEYGINLRKGAFTFMSEKS